jgi:hypothetical protein
VPLEELLLGFDDGETIAHCWRLLMWNRDLLRCDRGAVSIGHERAGQSCPNESNPRADQYG